MAVYGHSYGMIVKNIALSVLFIALSPKGFSQLASHSGMAGAPNVSTPKVPISHLYLNFLLFEAHLEQKAREFELEGKNGDQLRNLLRDKFHFTEAEFTPFRGASSRMEEEMKQIKNHALVVQQASDGLEVQRAKWKSLMIGRDLKLQQEVDSLGRSMSAARREQFEKDLINFFPQKQAQFQVSPVQNHPSQAGGSSEK